MRWQQIHIDFYILQLNSSLAKVVFKQQQQQHLPTSSDGGGGDGGMSDVKNIQTSFAALR